MQDGLQAKVFVNHSRNDPLAGEPFFQHKPNEESPMLKAPLTSPIGEGYPPRCFWMPLTSLLPLSAKLVANGFRCVGPRGRLTALFTCAIYPIGYNPRG